MGISFDVVFDDDEQIRAYIIYIYNIYVHIIIYAGERLPQGQQQRAACIIFIDGQVLYCIQCACVCVYISLYRTERCVRVHRGPCN